MKKPPFSFEFWEFAFQKEGEPNGGKLVSHEFPSESPSNGKLVSMKLPSESSSSEKLVSLKESLGRVHPMENWRTGGDFPTISEHFTQSFSEETLPVYHIHSQVKDKEQ